MSVVVETIGLPGGELVVERPHDAEALIEEERFGPEEFIPYWAELWPAGVALARALAGRALGGRRVLELGCGLGVPSIAAARAGARVLATDWAPEALEFVERNASLNNVELETAVFDWRTPGDALAFAPWDLVIASDVTYEARNIPVLLELLPRLGPEVWIADPGRAQSNDFLEGLGGTWERRTTFDMVPPHVAVHRLRRAAASPARR